MAIELVVAHYAEDLRWLGNIPPQIRVTVYDKNPDFGHPGARKLPNVGREAHTYLHHITERYETLAPLTIFCQGKPFDHVFDFRRFLRELAAGREKIEGFRWLGHIIDTDDAEGRLFKIWSKNPGGGGLDFAGFFRELFEEETPSQLCFYLGGQFAITREAIRQRPRSFYQKALEISGEFPEAAHCFERTWDRVFEVQGVPEKWQGQTVYLKPMRRLDAQ